MKSEEFPNQETLFGHPVGLYTLFFAEMWERFSYYGMRALLIFYMIKGFLRYGDKEAYAVYGAYTALVYATPFIGGMIADRLLGSRRSVVVGGLLMAAGHLVMTVQQETAFFVALALLIAGNGFFKPNISTIVGSLYPIGSTRRDGGFTIFYMGINLGAAMAPLLCGYVGEKFGWHWGFGLATLGMLIGVAIFVAPTVLTQALILVGAVITAAAMIIIQDNVYLLMVNIVVAVGLLVSAIVAVVALNRGGIPKEVGQPPINLKEVRYASIRVDWWVYLGIVVSIPVFVLLIQRNTITGNLLWIFGLIAIGYLFMYAVTSEKVERERLYVVLILTFFSFLFWAFFEQAGSSLNNFADRNVDRVFEQKQVEEVEVGTSIGLTLTQEQLGFQQDESVFTLNDLAAAREAGETQESWNLTEDHVGMGIAEIGDEVPASTFQSANPIFIVIFGLVLTWLWGALASQGMEPSTPFKFALGLLQLGLGFAVFWYAATQADSRGMTSPAWLLLGYLLHTTGELCLSPVGLSMVTKLSPGRIVSTVMGGWFVATACSNFLAGKIAQMTGVEETGSEQIPPPQETIGLFGQVYGQIAVIAILCSFVCFALVPLLKRWMHVEADEG